MNLELAIVETCSPEGCQVKMLSDGRTLAARFSALVLNRVRIQPGQMVAVDLRPADPEIAWRWYRVRVNEVTPDGVSVQDRERPLEAIQVSGLEDSLTSGDEVWVTGMEGKWEIHDRVSGEGPEHLGRLNAQVLPRIAALLSAAPVA